MPHEKIYEVVRLLVAQGFGPASTSKALRLIGEAVRVDRVYVFENTTRAGGGELLMSQRYEWSAASATPQLDNPDLQGLSYRDNLPSWVAPLRAGEPVSGLVRAMSRAEQAILAPQDIQSILVCPVSFNGRWWGFVGFDDCQNRRDWSPSEVALLRGLSTALAAGLRHASTRQSLGDARGALREVIRQCERLATGPKPAERARAAPPPAVARVSDDGVAGRDREGLLVDAQGAPLAPSLTPAVRPESPGPHSAGLQGQREPW
jgi:GAF domain-containing protein